MPKLIAKEPKKRSHLELAFITYLKMLAPHLKYECEYRFDPIRRWRFDFAFVDYKVAVEVDGGQWAQGGGRHNLDADREKINAAASKGWRVLRFSGNQIKNDPNGCISVLLRTINAN